MARLLGVRLLALDATVVIVPADVTAPSVAADAAQARDAARSDGLPPMRSRTVGRGLAQAVRDIDEGAAILAEVRH